MADFDIEDRSTWAWIDGYPDSLTKGHPDGNYVHVSAHDKYYALSGGVITERPCSTGLDGRPLFYNPDTDAADYQENVPAVRVYDSVVADGLVTHDQRT